MAQLHNTTLRSFDSQYSRTTHPDNLVKPLRPRDDRSASGHNWDPEESTCISFAPRFSQSNITTALTYNFYRPDALPSAQSTVSKHRAFSVVEMAWDRVKWSVIVHACINIIVNLTHDITRFVAHRAVNSNRYISNESIWSKRGWNYGTDNT